MRYVLAAILIGAIGAPAASALPTVSPKSVSASQTDPVMQIAKRGKQQAQRQSRSGNNNSGSGKSNASNSGGGDGGIHPLVGSGDY